MIENICPWSRLPWSECRMNFMSPVRGEEPGPGSTSLLLSPETRTGSWNIKSKHENLRSRKEGEIQQVQSCVLVKQRMFWVWFDLERSAEDLKKRKQNFTHLGHKSKLFCLQVFFCSSIHNILTNGVKCGLNRTGWIF